MPSLSHLSAPAKLNLFLHVTGQRPDGYHLLQSAFVLIDWADTLHIETRIDGRLQRHDLGATLPDNDLCLQAARLLQQESGTTLGADIHIDKHIPWGAGMGGGSSDAATVLKALNQLWALHWPTQRLATLALRLGADVPFFVHSQHAWVEGIGERITPLALPPQLFDSHLAVLKPPVAVPTPAIFASEHLYRDTPICTPTDFLAAPTTFGRNDLQGPASLYSSDIVRALGTLTAHFGNARMTGSGSAVFAWAKHNINHNANRPQPPAAPCTPELLGIHEAGWQLKICRLLSNASPALEKLE